jgi:UDP-3-O-acyl N-acetylglucosamine deacetylase
MAGFGYWSGKDVQVQFRPAPISSGIVFVREDLHPPKRIRAGADHRLEIPRRTSLGVGEVRVEMVEHIMAALAGLHIDNCEVWVDQPEMPGFDGSSLQFVESLLRAESVEQEAARAQIVIQQVVRVGDDSCWVEARPSSAEGMSLECRIDYGATGPIGKQSIALQLTPDSFLQELAPARTFILQEEAAWLRSQGLGLRVSSKDLLVFDDQGPIDNPLRYADECVRHKSLDLVGDLALAGCDLVGNFVAHCSGHRLNAALVRAILATHAIATPTRRSA